MRLKIGINGQFLDLRRGTQLQLDMQSPIYFGDRDPDLLPGIKAYTIAVPNTAHNRLLLNRPDRLDNPAEFLYESGWIVYYDDYLLLEGRLAVEDGVKDSDIAVTFVGGLAGNVDDMKERKLYDLDLGGSVEVGTTDAEVLAHAAVVAANPDNYDYVFPTVKIHKDGERNEDDEPTRYQFLNLYNTAAYVKTDTVELKTVYSTMAPMIRLRYLLEQALADVGYTLAGIFDTHELSDELNELILFNTTSLDTFTGSISPDGYTFADMSLKGKIDLRFHVPTKTSADVLRTVCNLLCIAPILDTAGRRMILTWVGGLLTTAIRRNWTEKVDPIFRREKPIEDIPLEFKYEHASEDDYAVQWGKQLNGLTIERTHDKLVDADNAITLDDDDTIIFIKSLNECFEARGVTRGPSPIVDMRAFSKGKDLGIINENQLPSYSPTADTLHMITKSEKRGVPRVDFVGEQYLPAYFADIVTPMQTGKQIKDIILLLYRGMQTGFGGNQYPLAASGPYDFNENIIGNMSLLWNGEKGLYDTWWAAWMTALRAMRPVVYATRLTAKDLSNLDWREKVRIDQHAYFVKRVQVTLTTDNIFPASVEYMQIN